MQDFVKTRLDPVLQNGYYSTILDKDTDSLKVKKLRDSFVFFRTSSKPGAFEGIDTDYISLDEYDRANHLADSSAEQSMSSSKYKIMNRWSTPSIPNTGIHRLFDQSDQHWYMHKCDRCNHYNQLSYDDYDPSSVNAGGNVLTVNPEGIDYMARTVVPGSFQFVCQKCGKPLDRWYNGQWVARFPDRTKGDRGVRGYMISQLNAVWVGLDDLKTKELNSTSKQAFYNYVLGMPFEDIKFAVKEDDVYSHVNEKKEFLQDLDDYVFVATGIDWGNIHWMTTLGLRANGQIDLIDLHSVVKTGATDSLNIGADIEQVKMQLSKINPDIIIADIGDSGDKVAQLINYYGENKVYGCEYNSSSYSTGQLVPTWNDDKHTVKVDKLMQNKRYISMLKEGIIRHPQVRPNKQLEAYTHHWMNVTIRDVEDERTGEFKQVIGRRGDDHYSQAGVYSMLGLERLRDLHYGSGKYTFGSEFIDLQYGGSEPTLPDIFNKEQ